jgi:Acetokinase family
MSLRSCSFRSNRRFIGLRCASTLPQNHNPSTSTFAPASTHNRAVPGSISRPLPDRFRARCDRQTPILRVRRKREIRARSVTSLLPLERANTNVSAALDYVLRWMASDHSGIDEIRSLRDIHAAGHRVVHGGELFKESVIIDDESPEGNRGRIDLAPGVRAPGEKCEHHTNRCFRFRYTFPTCFRSTPACPSGAAERRLPQPLRRRALPESSCPPESPGRVHLPIPHNDPRRSW